MSFHNAMLILQEKVMRITAEQVQREETDAEYTETKESNRKHNCGKIISYECRKLE